jgi:hypothetical protein
MAHIPRIRDRIDQKEISVCGHALMATYASEVDTHMEEVVDQKSNTDRDGLSILLNLSNNLGLEHEMTPIMAWSKLRAHPEFRNLSAVDIEKITEDLGRRVRCYGYVRRNTPPV